MSELRVDSVKSKGGGAPNLPKGVTISGIATAATLGATQVDVSNVNVSGVVTSGTLSGDLLSTGTPTLGLGVTINSSGLHISGVATAGIVSATTIFGNGANLAGIGATIAPLFYNPDVSDGSLEFTATGIGITFNQQIKAGTGNVTLRLVGAAGTVVENFGVGSSVTISENSVSFTPTADLDSDTVYHINYPSGCFTNNEGTDYVGTAYTFAVRPLVKSLFTWGFNAYGGLGLNGSANASKSSPTQIPGTTWSVLIDNTAGHDGISGAIKTDGTLWVWGSDAEAGELGDNTRIRKSSPVQIPGTTWSSICSGDNNAMATKTDGTLWSWGDNEFGTLGLNQSHPTRISSPTQIPGTTWTGVISTGKQTSFAIKTDGTMYAWGGNAGGILGTNTPDNVHRSSPVQVPGTNWSNVSTGSDGNLQFTLATKTDGTLWSWGYNQKGCLGQNQKYTPGGLAGKSSPTQIPGTTWDTGPRSIFAFGASAYAIKTDGTLWTWGDNSQAQLGHNEAWNYPSPSRDYSSPVQVPGTTWDKTIGRICLKTDGTLWSWGQNQYGVLANNTNGTYYSSPIQIPGTTWTDIGGSSVGAGVVLALKNL